MSFIPSDIGIQPIPFSSSNPFLNPLRSVPAKIEDPITIEHIDYRKQQVTKAKIPGKTSNGVLIGIGIGLVIALIIVAKTA